MRRNRFCCSLRARRSGSHHYENDSIFANRFGCVHPSAIAWRKKNVSRGEMIADLQNDFPLHALFARELSRFNKAADR